MACRFKRLQNKGRFYLFDCSHCGNIISVLFYTSYFYLVVGFPPHCKMGEDATDHGDVRIPKGLSTSETGIYLPLLKVADEIARRGQKPRPLVVITDAGKDYDDLAALTLLKELHRLKLVEVRAVVTNLMPVEKRVRFVRGALNELGLHQIPVAQGTCGSLEEHEELDYEFDTDFMAPVDSPAPEDGQELLRQTYASAKETGEKLHLVCLSSLQDVQQFANTYPDLFVMYTDEVYMQGGNRISPEGKFEPDEKAANNLFNLPAAAHFHTFLQEKCLSSHTYTKDASFAVPLTSELFAELEATGNPIGAHLRRVQVDQDLSFYARSCESDPDKRFAPYMDQNWFLQHKTDWPKQVHDKKTTLPVGKEVVPYLTKLVLYDVLAALGSAGNEVVDALETFRERDRIVPGCDTHFWILEGRDIVPERLSVAISSLMKGSLLAVQQGMGFRV